MRTLFVLLALVFSGAATGDTTWPGRPPDCWKEARLVHGAEQNDPWQHNTKITAVKAEKPVPGVFSPNQGYFFVVEGGRPRAKVTIYAEQDHLIQITFSSLYGLSDVHWINEKLIFMRPWWGRIVATDIIYDVEQQRVIYAETLRDGYIAYQQYLQSCPLHGCECIEKR
jgi:hypothetical protein